METLEWVALTRITIRETGQIIAKNTPFPSGIEYLDYGRLRDEGLIATLAEFQQFGNRCKSCSP